MSSDVKTFTCESCGNTYEFERENWSAKQADAEYDEQFAKEKAAGEERAIVCDTCYTKIMIFHEETWIKNEEGI